ncbi:unnamed protein product, partial [Choristocarpus tenellus]
MRNVEQGLVKAELRNATVAEILNSQRRENILRNERELHQVNTQPPVVKCQDVRRMLACQEQDMHMFSNPLTYRSRLFFTRFAFNFKE